MSAIVQETFDYSVVDEACAIRLRRAVDVIRRHRQSAAQNIMAIGAELIKVKVQLGRGHFGRWLEAEFHMNERTARNYMQAARAFGSKTETVSVLPETIIYALSSKSTPATIREDVVARLEEGQEPDLALIKEQVETAHDAARQERDQRRRSQTHKANKHQEARRVREREKERQEEDQRRERARATAQELIEEFTLPGVTRILDAANDFYVSEAIRKLREQPNDGLDIPPILRRSASVSAAVRND